MANAGYVVAEQARPQGIGSRLCQHLLQAARHLGFRQMQFNLVVSTNNAGIGCWRRNGVEVVGTLPGAFRHRRLGYVDALVMAQSLMGGQGHEASKGLALTLTDQEMARVLSHGTRPGESQSPRDDRGESRQLAPN